MGKAHIGVNHSHGYIMTDVDDSKYLAFRFRIGAKYCDTCMRKLLYAARKCCSEEQIRELEWLLEHPKDDSYGVGNASP